MSAGAASASGTVIHKQFKNRYFECVLYRVSLDPHQASTLLEDPKVTLVRSCYTAPRGVHAVVTDTHTPSPACLTHTELSTVPPARTTRFGLREKARFHSTRGHWHCAVLRVAAAIGIEWGDDECACVHVCLARPSSGTRASGKVGSAMGKAS